MTLSANFTSKSVFDQQGCRALTFALARLSCCFTDKIRTASNSYMAIRLVIDCKMNDLE